MGSNDDERTEPLEAAVFDLDGVITRTAQLHFTAWKQLFDEYLARRAFAPSEDRRPFTEEDYLLNVDGKPRLEGVRAVLASRGIHVPDGSPEDAPEVETIHGLGTAKNLSFRRLLERREIDVDTAMVALVRDLRSGGVPVGVATSSKNGALILRRARLEDLFDARVDGVISSELGLHGKPDPDIFVECARRLGCSTPGRALVVEDAASGVIAARRGGFGLVIGIDRGGNGLRLRESGADWIVRDTRELSCEIVRRYWERRRQARPNILREWPRAVEVLRGRSLAMFLDYDGTLTPIVSRPELAVLDSSMRQALERLARTWPTHIVSGRGLEDVRALVGLDGLWYAGSHGFDVAAPRGAPGGRQIAPEVEPEIHRAAKELLEATRHLGGALVEDKHFSVAVHYRLLIEARVPDLESIVDEVLSRHPSLRKGYGKKVFELRPSMDWDKGKALLWLIDAAGLSEAFPIYVGDDATDEDAFAVLSDRGLGVVVTDLPRPTAARWSLQDPVEVRELLERLADLKEESRR